MLPIAFLDFFSLFSLAVQKIFPAMKVSIAAILLMVVVKNFSVYFHLVPSHAVAIYLYDLVVMLLFFYFWSISLYVSYEFFQDRPFQLSQAFVYCAKRVWHVYAIFIIYSMVMVALFLLGRLLAYLLIHAGVSAAAANMLTFFIICAAPFLFLAVLFVLSFAIVIIQQQNFWQGLRQSWELVGFSHWLWCLPIYVTMVIIYFLVSPYTLHGHFLQQYYLSAPFDFIVFLILIPLLNNLFILILNNLQYQLPSTQMQ